MAKYRQYKNGIFGHRYKGYYIVKKEEKEENQFSILGADKTILDENIGDYSDAEWEIDKMTSSPETFKLLQELYAEEIYMLSKYFAGMMEKENAEGLSKSESEFYGWVKKIRTRKAANKVF